MRIPQVKLRKESIGLGFLTTLCLALLLNLSPALAHDTLISSNPAEGAEVVQTELTTVSLQYSAELLQLGNAAVVTDAAGNELFNGTVEPEGDTVSIPLNAVPEPGQLAVNWRVVSSDGHPIEGILTVQIVADPNYQAVQSEEAVIDNSTKENTTVDTAEETENAGQTQTDTAGNTDNSEVKLASEPANNFLMWTGIAVAILLGAGGVLFFVLKPKAENK